MRRFRRYRRGSVLILAIGVLMLMAVMATAFLAGSRSDHVSVVQHQANTQADLLIDGLVNTARARLLSDDASGSDDVLTDPWLASRVPTTTDPNAPYSGNAANDSGSNLAIWPAISGPVMGDDWFESPLPLPGGAPPRFSVRQRAQPTFVSVAGRTWPALRVTTESGPQTFLAGDADGDGVADAGLFRLPLGELNGITYYGAIRIIDNNASINLNTALSRDYDFLADGAGVLTADNPNAGAFTANVGLAELLRTSLVSADRTSLPPSPAEPTFDHLSQASNSEFQTLNQTRWNIIDAPVRPQGLDQPVYDDTRLAGGPVGARTDASQTHAEFQFTTIGDFLQHQVARRVNAPGVTTLEPSPKTARSTLADSADLAYRFALSPSDSSADALTMAIRPSIQFGPGETFPGTPIRTQPYASGAGGIDAWFTTHFDTMAENPADAATWPCRRTLLTGVNGVGTLSIAPALPPALFYLATDPAWSRRRADAYPPIFTPLGSSAPVPTVPMAIASAADKSNIGVDPKVSINTGRFEELFYAFFKVMARPGFTGAGDDAGTPFSKLHQTAIAARSGVAFDRGAGIYTDEGSYYSDPYIGTRFTRPLPANASAFSARSEPPGLASVINGQTSSTMNPVAEQHPLRMFRSPLRPPPAINGSSPPSAAVWDDKTPRLPADQVLVLRSALAAANLEARRDSSHAPNSVDEAGSQNDRAVAHHIPLTALIEGVKTSVVAHVYGLRRQPFITEVYANTLARVNGAILPAPPPGGVPNPKGYVAIKIYNPTAVPISLQHCRLVGLRRSRSSPYGSPEADRYPAMRVRPLAILTVVNTAETDQIDLGTAKTNVMGNLYPPYVVPPHGTLVLENLPGIGIATPATALEDANYRPNSSGMVAIDGTNAGPITPADFLTQNVAYVPGLSRVVWDRDLVLMRPANCQPPSPDGNPANTLTYIPTDPDEVPPAGVAGFVPLDSYDFTGLAPRNDPAYSPTRTRADAWHYVRPVPASGATAGSWQFVYPGRYDADQSIPTAGGELPAPRQQGTRRAVGIDGQFGWDPTGGDKDPLAERPSPGVAASMGQPIALGTTASYPDPLTIRLVTSRSPGDQPLHDFTRPNAAGQVRPNLFPFGGLRRLGDLVDVPFIGSYTIQSEADAADGVDRFIEITPVTMDAVFAEDTDPADNETPSDDGTQSREQVGHFVPLRPTTVGPFQYDDSTDQADETRHRYAFANALFDHFIASAPHDDYVPNYPTQPNWRPGTSYSLGDVVQYGQHLFVCKRAHLSGNDEAASKDAPDWLDAGTTDGPYPVPPTTTANWQPLPRYALANNRGPAGSRSDIASPVSGNPRPYDYRTSNDANELGELVPGLINLNTAPEKVLAMLPWSPRTSAAPDGDALTFRFDMSPPTATAGGDGIDDNAQIAHAIVLYRDGRAAAVTTDSPNALNIPPSSYTLAAADKPFESLWDLYKVPGIQAAQAALLATMPTEDGTQFDGAQQSLLLNRVSNLLTTRSDCFTLYAMLQGWRDAGTDHAQLVVQRRAAIILCRERSFTGESSVRTISRIPSH